MNISKKFLFIAFLFTLGVIGLYLITVFKYLTGEDSSTATLMYIMFFICHSFLIYIRFFILFILSILNTVHIIHILFIKHNYNMYHI